MVQVTKAALIDAIRNSFESTLPDEIFAVLKTFDGKPVTNRIVTALSAAIADHDFSLTLRCGWTDLSWSGASKGGMILVLSEKSVQFDAAAFLKENVSHFEGRVERNKKRTEMLADEAWLLETVNAFNEYILARTVAYTKIAGLFAGGNPLESTLRDAFLADKELPL